MENNKAGIPTLSTNVVTNFTGKSGPFFAHTSPIDASIADGARIENISATRDRRLKEVVIKVTYQRANQIRTRIIL